MKLWLLGLLARFVAWLNRKAYEAGKRDGQAAARQEHERAADALREDYEQINNDGRTPADAYASLRLRNDKDGRRVP